MPSRAAIHSRRIGWAVVSVEWAVTVGLAGALAAPVAALAVAPVDSLVAASAALAAASAVDPEEVLAVPE